MDFYFALRSHFYDRRAFVESLFKVHGRRQADDLPQEDEDAPQEDEDERQEGADDDRSEAVDDAESAAPVLETPDYRYPKITA